MSLWGWALEVYERPGTAEACLRLQDDFGQNTSYLLWAWWARATDEALLARAAAATRAWDETALKPLRTVRRGLKAGRPPIDDAAREALREEVKTAELHAERVLMETLERLVAGPDEGATGPAALEAAVKAWGDPASAAALASLATALV